jgi:hypothetical protein
VKKPAEQGDCELAPAEQANPGAHAVHAAPALPAAKVPAGHTVG